jgi:hypothetical protein
MTHAWLIKGSSGCVVKVLVTDDAGKVATWVVNRARTLFPEEEEITFAYDTPAARRGTCRVNEFPMYFVQPINCEAL